MSYAVGQVSVFAGVTVRTLHHYDKAGLLSPSGRSHVGYRRYSDADRVRLQQILFYRELGFSLVEIAAIFEDPQANALDRLRARQRQLGEEIARLQRLAEVAERAIEVQQTGVVLTPEERFEVFGEIAFDLSYATQAEQKWAHSEGQHEAMARAAAHTKENWRQLMGEATAWRAELLAAFDEGIRATASGPWISPRNTACTSHAGSPPAHPTCTAASRTTSSPTRAPSPLSYRLRSNARGWPPTRTRRSTPTQAATRAAVPKRRRTGEDPDRSGRIAW